MANDYAHSEISSAIIEHEGVSMTLRDWCSRLRVPYVTVRMRYKRGKRDFSSLFSYIGGDGRIDVKEGVVVSYQRTVLDDLLTADQVGRVRDAAKEYDMSPLQLVQTLVDKGLNKLSGVNK